MDSSSENNDLISIQQDDIKLTQNTEEVVHSIVEEQDSDKVKDLTALFNLNMVKKNALRTLKLSELLDKVSDNMTERFEKRPDEFSNKDLIDYMNVVGSTLEKSQKSLNQIEDIPPIKYNQQNTQVNINIMDGLSRESRENILEAIKSIIGDGSSIQDINNPQEELKDGE